ncbi:TetR/AcrR family transcriptional regulator [Paenibacillus nasutitermitis]|uniref:TetR family transcriptional regulator n=1 Tax=Paenibacillus nasutitermitis TaxID=1652958 RepID=A0A916Z0S2_9BACL|nr:TetR/AcrR family transcriptional regulator [Paenibacillus nasutitermitis]GGD70516.1 TetR family transcriptional regulator [Paenibacillus nasutitermitis]
MEESIEQWLAELEKIEAAGGKMTEKQSKILQAAIEVFAEKGFAAASTNEIAQRAGVAEGTIFRHYKTKKDLLLSIVAPVMGKLIAPFVLRDFNKVLDLDYERYDQFLRAVIANRIEFLHNHMHVLKILIQEIPFHPELQEQFRKNILAKVLERMNRIVDQFKMRGQLLDLPNLTIIRLTVSALIGYVAASLYHEQHEGSAWDDEREREDTISFIVRGLGAS